MKADIPPPNSELTYIVTRQEAARILNRPDSARYNIHVKAWAPCADDPDKGFEPSGYVTVTRDEAIRFARNLFNDKLEEKGARVRITMADQTRLRRVRGDLKEVPYTTVWIG